jgi:murein DD-endopeptidase MepM/ murein hydrolase activator NlpD
VVYPLSARREGRWRTQRIAITGSFSRSLPDALREALPDSLLSPHERLVMALDLAAQLRWQVDFTRDLDPGDRYAILFVRLIDEQGETRYGRVDGVELFLGREHVTAFAFDGPDGRILYFDDQGRSVERNFLSSPMDVERVTSGFTSARFHPCCGAGARTRASTTGRVRARPCARSRRAPSCAPAGRAGTASWSRSGIRMA